jgi:Flp pilus assembly protein TadG
VEFALVLPIMLVVLLAILDFSRIYTTMTSVESAAREAADYGTTLGAGKWAGALAADTVAEMEKRACVAASDLPDYRDDEDPPNPANGCVSPAVDICLTPASGGTCYRLADLPSDAACDDPLRTSPCTVTVTLTHTFDLISPFNLDVFGIQIGVPDSITFARDSTFAMTDIDLSGPATAP